MRLMQNCCHRWNDFKHKIKRSHVQCNIFPRDKKGITFRLTEMYIIRIYYLRVGQ